MHSRAAETAASIFCSVSFSAALSRFIRSIVSLLCKIEFSATFICESISESFSSKPEAEFLISSNLMFMSLVPSAALSIISPIFESSS